MPRNIFYRDFTICKAVALIALIGLAAAMGGVPRQAPAVAESEANEARIIPAMVYKVWDGCDKEEVGVNL